jgi:dihydrofolate reductase
MRESSVKIYHIVAMDENYVIAKNGRIPWKISQDLKRFRELTSCHAIIMGRVTLEFDLKNKPLPNRLNVVLSRQYDASTYPDTSLVIVDTVGKALQVCNDKGYNEVYIIGGGSIYEQTLPLVDEIRLTQVHTEVLYTENDDMVYYTNFDEQGDWTISYQKSYGEYSYIDYVRTTAVSNAS